jgi:hypothetical protein
MLARFICGDGILPQDVVSGDAADSLAGVCTVQIQVPLDACAGNAGRRKHRATAHDLLPWLS